MRAKSRLEGAEGTNRASSRKLSVDVVLQEVHKLGEAERVDRRGPVGVLKACEGGKPDAKRETLGRVDGGVLERRSPKVGAVRGRLVVASEVDALDLLIRDGLQN